MNLCHVNGVAEEIGVKIIYRQEGVSTPWIFGAARRLCDPIPNLEEMRPVRELLVEPFLLGRHPVPESVAAGVLESSVLAEKGTAEMAWVSEDEFCGWSKGLKGDYRRSVALSRTFRSVRKPETTSTATPRITAIGRSATSAARRSGPGSAAPSRRSRRPRRR